MINFSFLLNRENLDTHTHRERECFTFESFSSKISPTISSTSSRVTICWHHKQKINIYYRCRAHCVAEFVDNWSCRLYTERTLEKVWVKSNIILKASITEGETHLSYLPSLKTFFLFFLLIKYFINIKVKDTREAPMRKIEV